MDPWSVKWFQAVPWAFVAVVIAVIFGRDGSLCVLALSAMLALCWKGLLLRYEARRNEHPSETRLRGDRVLRSAAAFVFGPAVAVVVIAAIGLHPLVSPQWTAIPLAIPLLAILASSLVDWYVILPFRDGVEGEPVCKAEVTNLRRRRYTKLWIAHRLACEAAIAVSLLIAALLLLNHYGHGLGAAVNVVSFVGGASIAVGLAWKRWVMGGLRFCLRQSPALGSWVEGFSHSHDEGYKRREGFVRDVSLDNGVKVVTSPEGKEYFIALVDAVPDITRPHPEYHCHHACKAWLRMGDEITCEVHLRDLETAPVTCETSVPPA